MWSSGYYDKNTIQYMHRVRVRVRRYKLYTVCYPVSSARIVRGDWWEREEESVQGGSEYWWAEWSQNIDHTDMDRFGGLIQASIGLIPYLLLHLKLLKTNL